MNSVTEIFFIPQREFSTESSKIWDIVQDKSVRTQNIFEDTKIMVGMNFLAQGDFILQNLGRWRRLYGGDNIIFFAKEGGGI